MTHLRTPLDDLWDIEATLTSLTVLGRQLVVIADCGDHDTELPYITAAIDALDLTIQHLGATLGYLELTVIIPDENKEHRYP